MESDQLTADAIMLHKKQMIALMDETIERKKLQFKQLMADFESLESEISGLENDLKNLISASAEKSLMDCLY
ncbi:MAG: hypothetical protein ACRYGB_04495 [Janthinobacterium lividum]